MDTSVVNDDDSVATIHYKVVVLGAANAGKTSLISRWATRTFVIDDRSRRATVGIDFVERTLDNGVCLGIWDTAGQEHFHSLSRSYVRDAHAVIYVYDATSLPSLYAAKALSHTSDGVESREPMQSPPVSVLVGTKCDLRDQEHTLVSAARVAESMGVNASLRCSARTGDRIDELFNVVCAYASVSERVQTMIDDDRRHQQRLVHLNHSVDANNTSQCMSGDVCWRAHTLPRVSEAQSVHYTV